MDTTFLGIEAYLLPYFICYCSPLTCAISIRTAIIMQFFSGAPAAIGHSFYTLPEAQLFLVPTGMSLIPSPSMDFGMAHIWPFFLRLSFSFFFFFAVTSQLVWQRTRHITTCVMWRLCAVAPFLLSSPILWIILVTYLKSAMADVEVKFWKIGRHQKALLCWQIFSNCAGHFCYFKSEVVACIACLFIT